MSVVPMGSVAMPRTAQVNDCAVVTSACGRRPLLCVVSFCTCRVSWPIVPCCVARPAYWTSCLLHAALPHVWRSWHSLLHDVKHPLRPSYERATRRRLCATLLALDVFFCRTMWYSVLCGVANPFGTAAAVRRPFLAYCPFETTTWPTAVKR